MPILRLTTALMTLTLLGATDRRGIAVGLLIGSRKRERWEATVNARGHAVYGADTFSSTGSELCSHPAVRARRTIEAKEGGA